MLRKIIRIDEEKCTGCGDCIPNCPEGALQVIDGKARLVSDLFCDGLGACIGHCPEDAITIEEREAEEYDEDRVMENIVKAGANTIKAHLDHLKEHGETDFLNEAIRYLKAHGIESPYEEVAPARQPDPSIGCSSCPGAAPRRQSRLGQWPVQIMLVPPAAAYFKDADLLLAADCVPFAYPEFHEDFLSGKIVLVGCPKLDDAQFYVEKITEILKQNDFRSLTVVHMEVPCCTGTVRIAQAALGASGKEIPAKAVQIGIKGDILSEMDLSVAVG
ncbi:MAG: 4Fe-4S binding protein [Candidatus Eisenbacteria sp.]|nr:4Fe-4S binding protein [Candidatus Eisenbacteria bacterium]